MPGLTTTERRPGYTAAWNALGRPEPNLDEAAMTDGRLQIRIQAWDREQAWQPPYVDNHLRAAETDLQPPGRPPPSLPPAPPKPTPPATPTKPPNGVTKPTNTAPPPT